MKVSVITPVFNQARFIKATIESVLDQTYSDIEYIVVDDGSNDETPEIVKCYSNRLTYLRHDNIGESRTVNRGYREVTGEIVGVVNSDDPLFTPDAVAKIVECFNEYPESLAVYPDWVSVDESGAILNHIDVPQYSIENMLRGFNVSLGPGMFIRRSALELIGYRNESLKYTGDLDMSFRLAMKGPITHLSGFLATHRVHGAAASTVAKGPVMANEVARLAEVSFENSVLPQSLQNDRRKILSHAHFIASFFSKPFSVAFFRHVMAAIWLNPSLIKKVFSERGRAHFVSLFGAFPQLQRLLARLLK